MDIRHALQGYVMEKALFPQLDTKHHERMLEATLDMCHGDTPSA